MSRASQTAHAKLQWTKKKRGNTCVDEENAEVKAKRKNR
jgi:hypothetical protein